MGGRTLVVAGNWKMNGSRAFVERFADAFVSAAELRDAVTVVLFPPLPYLESLLRRLEGTGVECGAQNAHTASEGAFTGEVAPEMIRDLGGRWVLVGHSERREYFSETDDVVADKFAAAVRADLRPVLCVGETLDERQRGRAEAVVCGQLSAVVSRVGADSFARAAVAYEPVWAIGTGQTATPDQAQGMHEVIRQQLHQELGTNLADALPVLYGGSMNAENAPALMRRADIDGGLVGGASLKPEAFAAIVAAAGAVAAGRSRGQ